MRFRVRHLQQTLADHVEAELARLGWVNDPVNFSTRAFTVLDTVPGEPVDPDEPNTVAVALGSEGADEAAELGGLREATWALAVEIYGEQAGIAVAVASDLKGALADLEMPVTDYTPVTPVPTEEWLAVEDLIVERPARANNATEWKRNVRSLTGTVTVYFAPATP